MELHQMDDTEFVINKLVKYNSRDDIVAALCERSGYKWEEATNFVRRIEFYHSHRIRVRQQPLLVSTGALMIVGGLAVMAYSLYSWLSGEVMPFTLTLLIFEFYFPNGGQLAVGLPISGVLLLGGVVGIWLAMRKERNDKSVDRE